MAPNTATEEQIAQLQQQEQQVQQTILQRQTLQSQLLETENALDTLNKTKEQPFKSVGPLLVAVDKKTLHEELTSKKEMLAIRLKNIEQQEEQLRKQFQESQEKLLKQLQQ
ncbi:prefoldin subunit beta [Candidatus Woesearchaeota archaeon]|nr:prefoldin subunit beta [Candidatus Woesearchaeota archaeon]